MKILLKYLTILLIFNCCTTIENARYGGLPTQRSYKHFTNRKIDNQSSVFNFKDAEKDYNLGGSIVLTNKALNATNVTLDSFVNLHKTIAFLIIRNDTILYEKYIRNYTDTSLISSFSLVKPMISTLIGIAIAEGKIDNINSPISNYLDEYKGKAGFEEITIKNLLQHNSGIQFTDEKFSLTSDNAQFYWGNNLREKLSKLTLETAPDIKFHYSSANTQLLALIIERVTNEPISKYLETKIWKPLGMEAPAYWSLDNDNENGMEKSFCCLQARAIDYAKFGRLYLNEGKWEGEKIISRDWVSQSTHSDPENNNRLNYNYNWGIGPLKYGSFYAVGLYGQYLYLFPKKNIQIVRFGDAELSYNPSYWLDIFIQIIDQLDKS
jgi:CubicO group peptidase (beta-lactamase class C family)